MQEPKVVEEEEMVGESDDEVEVKHDTKKDIIWLRVMRTLIVTALMKRWTRMQSRGEEI